MEVREVTYTTDVTEMMKMTDFMVVRGIGS